MRHALRFLAAAVCLALLDVVGLGSAPSEAMSAPAPLTVPVAMVFHDHQTGAILPALTVSVSRRTDNAPPFVDLHARAGTDLDPQALAATLTHALPHLGLDPHGLTVTVTVASRLVLHGDSVTAALVVATAAALTNRTFVPGRVVTGTVNPDGTLGPIGDLSIKAHAATTAGYTLVYPARQASALADARHEAVATILEAYERLTR